MSAFISLEQVHWRQKRLQVELEKLGEEISDDLATLTAPPAGDSNVMETFMDLPVSSAEASVDAEKPVAQSLGLLQNKRTCLRSTSVERRHFFVLCPLGEEFPQVCAHRP